MLTPCPKWTLLLNSFNEEQVGICHLSGCRFRAKAFDDLLIDPQNLIHPCRPMLTGHISFITCQYLISWSRSLFKHFFTRISFGNSIQWVCMKHQVYVIDCWCENTEMYPTAQQMGQNCEWMISVMFRQHYSSFLGLTKQITTDLVFSTRKMYSLRVLETRIWNQGIARVGFLRKNLFHTSPLYLLVAAKALDIPWLIDITAIYLLLHLDAYSVHVKYPSAFFLNRDSCHLV